MGLSPGGVALLQELDELLVGTERELVRLLLVRLAVDAT